MKTVHPKAASDLSMSTAQLFGSGPKWTITCGSCNGTFRKRIPMIDRPGIQCPYCGDVNVLPVVITR